MKPYFLYTSDKIHHLLLLDYLTDPTNVKGPPNDTWFPAKVASRTYKLPDTLRFYHHLASDDCCE